MSKQMNNSTAARRALAALGLLVVLCAGAPALASPALMSAYGDQLPWYGSEINAMGGTGAALYRGGLSNILNPAFLAQEKGRRLDAGLSLDQTTEDRFQPLFDTFDNYVTDAAIASNRQHYWQTGFGLAARLGEGGRLPVTVAVSLTDRYPFGYTFEEELRSPSLSPSPAERDQILEQRLYEVTGTLRNLSLGAAVDLNDVFSAGVAMHYAFGTRKQVESVRDKQIPLGQDDESYNYTTEYDLSGVNWTLGLRAKVSDRIEVGVAWETQLTADGTFKQDFLRATPDTNIVPFDSYRGEFRYPNAYRAGLTFKPQTDPRTTFSLEVEYKPWSEMLDSQNRSEAVGYNNPIDLADVTDVRVGLEHMFYNGMPLRFGFRFIDAYADKEASTSVFSAGVGMPFGGGMISASLELSKLTNIQEHVFGYPDDYLDDAYATDPEARVEDTRFRVGAGYMVNF
jgi:hypothetical protein